MKTELSVIPGLTLHSPSGAPEATSLVTFTLEGKNASDIVSELWTRKRIVCRAIQPLNGVRLSLHIFNTESDIAQAFDAIQAL